MKNLQSYQSAWLKLFFIPFILSFSPVLAQNSGEYQSLKKHNDPIFIDYYVAPYFELGRGVDHFTWFAGADAAFVFNKKVVVGFYAATAPLGYYPSGYSSDEGFGNYFEHAGFLTSYIFEPNKAIHPYAQLKAGWGNLAIGYDGDWTNVGTYIVQPAFGIEFNLNDHLRLNFDLHYRIGSPLDLYVYKDGFIDGSGISLGIRYGSFN